ncbi:S8 family serine peptidase [Pseudoneobacillus sp. C159]
MKKQMNRVLAGALSVLLITPVNVLAATQPLPQTPSQWDQIQAVNTLKLNQLKQLARQEKVYIEETINTKTSNPVNVIVELVGDISKQKAKTIQATQTNFIQGLTKQGMDVIIEHTYDRVLNGMAMTIPGNKITELAENPNVKAIYEDGIVTATPIYSEDASDGVPVIGGWEMNEAGFKGEGMKVGVIDTGVDYLHPDLKDAFKGGYDLVDMDSDPYETKPDGQLNETTHGTHVAGTILGRNVSGHGVRGVAPKADLYAYRVLGPGGSGYDSDVIAGIEKSVEDDMDVINLSLGNGQEHNPYSPSAIAVNNAILNGVTVVLSNGNEGVRGRYSVGSPASSDMAISVGASTLANTRFTGSVDLYYRDPANWQNVNSATVKTDQSPIAKGSNIETRPDQSSTVQTTNEEVNESTKIKSTFPIKVMAWNQADGPEGYAKNWSRVPLVYVGEGTNSDYKSNVKGKAVLITRGDVTFIEKINNAKKAGAIAAFIFDKDSQYKGPINFYLGAGDYIPTYSMSEEAGKVLLKVAQTYPDDEFMLDFGTFESVVSQGDEITSFSSRGPSNNLNIKPDVVAPGANIRSSIATYGGDYTEAYQTMDGTSMAAPHVAGLAVLLKQKNPNYSHFDIKAALMNTTKILETPKYTVFDQGAGRVQGMKALNTNALAMVLDQTKADGNRDGHLDSTDYYTGNVRFGEISPSETEAVSKTKSILLKDVAGKDQTYRVHYQLTAPEQTNNVTLSVPETVQLSANQTTSFDVSILVPAATPAGEYQGYIYLTNVETGEEIHLPFVSFVGAVNRGDDFSKAEINYAHFSPNGDGNRDTLPVKFGLYNKAEVVIAELYDTVTGGYLGAAFGYVADAEHPALEAGEYTVEWDGTFQPWWSPERMDAPDGKYVIALVGFAKIPDNILAPPFVKWIESDLFIEREKPNVIIKASDFIAESKTYKISGRVEGMYPSMGRGELVKIDYSVRYIVDDRSNGGDLAGTNDSGFFYANPDGTFEGEIKVDPGHNRIAVEATTPAHNYSERPHNPSYLQLHVGSPTQYITGPNKDIKLGEEFAVTVDARYVKKFIGGDLGFMYDENTMEFLGAEATEEIKAYGDVTIIEKDLGSGEDIGIPFPGIIGPPPGPGPFPGDDEEPSLMHSYKVALALKGEVAGVDGDIPYMKLKFKATTNIKKVNLTHTIMVTDNNVVSLDKTGQVQHRTSFAVNGEVVLHAPNQKIIGHVNSFFPEVYQDGTDFSQKGIKVYASWGGYWFAETNHYSGGHTIEGIVHADGSFTIEGLPADQTFTVRLFVPGHLPGIMTGLQLISENDGIYSPDDVSVKWGAVMLAGNINNDNVINILDLAILSRYFGATNATAEMGDINQDGTIDILDLSYITANYDSYNENILNNYATIPIPKTSN